MFPIAQATSRRNKTGGRRGPELEYEPLALWADPAFAMVWGNLKQISAEDEPFVEPTPHFATGWPKGRMRSGSGLELWPRSCNPPAKFRMGLEFRFGVLMGLEFTRISKWEVRLGLETAKANRMPSQGWAVTPRLRTC